MDSGPIASPYPLTTYLLVFFSLALLSWLVARARIIRRDMREQRTKSTERSKR